MLGLAVLFFIALYLLITWGVVRLAVRWARRHGRRGWVWGGVAALAMYNLMFWDLIPTLLIHKYYCATEAGLWVYKAPEEWVKENPGVLETLSVGHLPEAYRIKSKMLPFGGSEEYLLSDGTRLMASYGYDHRTKSIVLNTVYVETPDHWSGIQLNERIRSLRKDTKGFPFSIRRNDEKLIDVQSNAVLSSYITFNWGNSSALSLGPTEPIRALGTAYLAGGGGCGVDYQDFRNYLGFFRKKGN